LLLLLLQRCQGAITRKLFHQSMLAALCIIRPQICVQSASTTGVDHQLVAAVTCVLGPAEIEARYDLCFGVAQVLNELFHHQILHLKRREASSHPFRRHHIPVDQ